VPGDGAAEALVDRMLARPDRSGGFDWTPTGAGSQVRGERAMGVDQTHESVVVGESAVVKWSVTAAASPAPQLLSHLHVVAFPDVPTPWGFVEHEGLLVAAVDRFLPGAQDGWTWCVDDLASDVSAGRPAATTDAARLGSLVGGLHVALATPSRVLPEPIVTAGRDQVHAWHGRARSALARAVHLVQGPEGERLRARADRAAEVVDELLAVESTPVARAHGDLHVGQVLRWEGGYAVTDFDGNPVVPAEERLLPEPLARDVAGMLQSLDHVGRVVLRRVPGVETPLVAEWIGAAQAAFLGAYRATLAGAKLADLLDERLLRAFAVEQECREYAYATSHLPRWLYVPDAAFAALFPEE
jgi:maltokinase